MPSEIISLDGLFLNNFIKIYKTLDFKNSTIVKDSIHEASVNKAVELSSSKEFKEFDQKTLSDLYIVIRTSVLFWRNRRVEKKEYLDNMLKVAENLVFEWSKNSSRIAVRGPTVNYNFCEWIISLIKLICYHIDYKKYTKDTIKTSLSICLQIVNKLVVKLKVASSNLTLNEFRLLCNVVKLEAKVLQTKEAFAAELYSDIFNDTLQDFDFHLLFTLRILSTHYYLIKETTDPRPDLSIAIKEQCLLGGSYELLFTQEHLLPEGQFKMKKLTRYLISTLLEVSNINAANATMIKNGAVHSILDITFKVYSSEENLKEKELKNHILSLLVVLRRILINGAEATINHFGDVESPAEVGLRGAMVENYITCVSRVNLESKYVLIEFFRIARKLLHLKFIYKLIGGYEDSDNLSSETKH